VSKEMHELRQKNKQLADQISKIIITKFWRSFARIFSFFKLWF
jgi:hypothetical protein